MYLSQKHLKTNCRYIRKRRLVTINVKALYCTRRFILIFVNAARYGMHIIYILYHIIFNISWHNPCILYKLLSCLWLRRREKKLAELFFFSALTYVLTEENIHSADLDERDELQKKKMNVGSSIRVYLLMELQPERKTMYQILCTSILCSFH